MHWRWKNSTDCIEGVDFPSGFSLGFCLLRGAYDHLWHNRSGGFKPLRSPPGLDNQLNLSIMTHPEIWQKSDIFLIFKNPAVFVILRSKMQLRKFLNNAQWKGSFMPEILSLFSYSYRVLTIGAWLYMMHCLSVRGKSTNRRHWCHREI